MKDLNKPLQERKQRHLYRQRRISDSPQHPEMIIDGKNVLGFCSNDYLGLANHPEVKSAFIEGINQYGAGSGAAHLINGHTRAHHELEEQLAEFCGYPRALLFSTGYMANLGVIQTMVSKGDTVLEDRLNHASLLDGGLLSGARLMRYSHNDSNDLDSKLASREKGEKLVVSDGVFSMDGDMADVKQLAGCCQHHDAWLMIDDAHGIGVVGSNGKGSLEHTGVSTDDVPIYMATLGKALGTSGAFVAGSEDLVETIIQSARTYIYTTAAPPAIATATLASLRLVREQPELRTALNDNIAYFRQCCEQKGINLTDSSTAIQPLIIGNTETAVTLSNELFEQGLLVTAIRPPTVPEGTARLRVTLSAQHTHTHIDRLVNAITDSRTLLS